MRDEVIDSMGRSELAEAALPELGSGLDQFGHHLIHRGHLSLLGVLVEGSGLDPVPVLVSKCH